MSVRYALMALALLTAPSVAFAQEAAPAQAPAAESAPQGEAGVVAMRDLYHALFFDTGMYDMMIDALMPEFRRSITTSQLYLQGDSRRRAALDDLVNRVPDIMRDELRTESQAMAQNVAPRVTHLLNAEQITGLAEFMRAPEWRPVIQRMIGAEMQQRAGGADGVQLTQEEEDAFARFEFTPLGQIMLRHGDAFMAIVMAEFEAATPRIEPRIQMRMMHEMCDALDRDCPPEFRRALRGT